MPGPRYDQYMLPGEPLKRHKQVQVALPSEGFKYDQLGKIKQVVSRRHMLGLAFKYDQMELTLKYDP